MSVRKASLNVAEIKRSSGQQGRTDADLELVCMTEACQIKSNVMPRKSILPITVLQVG